MIITEEERIETVQVLRAAQDAIVALEDELAACQRKSEERRILIQLFYDLGVKLSGKGEALRKALED